MDQCACAQSNQFEIHHAEWMALLTQPITITYKSRQENVPVKMIPDVYQSVQFPVLKMHVPLLPSESILWRFYWSTKKFKHLNTQSLNARHISNDISIKFSWDMIPR